MDFRKNRISSPYRETMVGMNRRNLRAFLKRARKEFREARLRGFTKEQIVEALREGDRTQKAYAEYLEHFITEAA